MQGTHSTKTISEVSGTGRKPWNQKGTGRARHGTLRGPQVTLSCLFVLNSLWLFGIASERLKCVFVFHTVSRWCHYAWSKTTKSCNQTEQEGAAARIEDCTISSCSWREGKQHPVSCIDFLFGNFSPKRTSELKESKRTLKLKIVDLDSKWFELIFFCITSLI